MRYNGAHELNFNIDIDGSLCGTIVTTPETAPLELCRLEKRIHDALANEFKHDNVEYSVKTTLETDEPRITAIEVLGAFSQLMGEQAFFTHTDIRLFRNIVESCIDDINQELIGFGHTDPREASYNDIVKCTWRAIAIGMKCDSEL